MDKKLVQSIPMTLITKETSIKIGKLSDIINTEKSMLTKDPQGKTYKLIEKRQNKDEMRFTGSLMAEQNSKYIIMQYNQDTGRIEVSPVGDWYSFKKEISYPTMSIEEVEEKMKNKTTLLDYIRNKGVLTKVKKEKKIKTAETTSNRVPFGRLNDEDEDMEDEVRTILNGRNEEQSEEEREEDVDPELKDIPSDIEEGFIKGKIVKDEKKTEINLDDSISLDDDDNLFGADEDEEENNNDEEEADDSQGFSEIDKEEDLTNEQENYISLNPSNQEFVKMKRKGDDKNLSNINQDRKKIRMTSPIEEVLEGLFAKNKRMTHDKIVRELYRNGFSEVEVNTHLGILLNKMCDKFPQGGEFFYFRKSEV